MRGRKPKSAKLKLLEGNPGKRPLEDTSPKPKPILPKRSSHLKGEARRAWDFYNREAYWLTEADATILEVLCVEIGIACEARKIINREGILDESKPTVRPHPACKVANDADKIIIRLSQELGFTPASRSRLNLPEPDNEDDELERLINRNN